MLPFRIAVAVEKCSDRVDYVTLINVMAREYKSYMLSF